MAATVNDASLIMQNIPRCLRALRQWVCWKRQPGRNGETTKVPHDAKTGRKASSTDPVTWTTFEQAVQAYAGGGERYDGVGFVFTKDDPFCGIDLDDCIRSDGSLAPWAQEIVDRFPTYTEISPSETGVKMFMRGRKGDFADCSVKDIDPDGAGGELEVYDKARYFCVTGNLYPGSPADATDCQQALDELCKRYWGGNPQPSVAPAQQAPGQTQVPLQVHNDDRVARCLGAMLDMNIADKSDGSFRLLAAACRCVEHDLTDAEALVSLKAYGALKPFPTKWSAQDLLKRLRDAEGKADRGSALLGGAVKPAYRTVGELLVAYPELRRPVVHGLLREGETMNVIAPSKTGKSWLTIDLALAVATGRPWLGTYQTAKGKVLILDNELHGETSANRIPRVADARLIRLTEVANAVCVENMRGRLVDLLQLESYFNAIQPGEFKVVVLDAFYRFVPKDTDENDNGTVAQLYNHIDRYAQRLGCCFVLIHHSTKGNQSAKAITDVGAGAGSQSRATDTHLILRPHQQDGVVVLDAAVRSWPPIAPMCLEWVYPVWNPVADLDPADLRTDRRPRKSKEEPPAPKVPEWDTDMFVKTCVSDEGWVKDVVLETATRNGVSKVRARTLLRLAEAEGKVHRWVAAANKPVRFATAPQPLIETPTRRRALS